MALLNIRKNGDGILRKKCRPVEEITPRILTLLDDMRETLKDANGVGLAAPQVGVLKRIVLVDDGSEILELINPVIVDTKGEQEEIEACLSCPGQWGIVKRPAEVTVRALDRHGVEKTYTGTGLTARCFCHELDHLDGVLYIDKAERMLDPDEIETED
ncbi:MAG: peptide deformylase [Clostridia bacterium]|jgi:peptide deformylase|nr:peptide deformylase [Clostridia bacterium]MBO7401133.1 peptide deformylase [Clostridia bacterium]MBO7549136.1 peptide deformylase [Clostridia bacterium]MBP5238083.1 peptide deformylase [Clostridia bacterium]MBP5657335.1 peptide deformylase [Clostridia bacterium]